MTKNVSFFATREIFHYRGSDETLRMTVRYKMSLNLLARLLLRPTRHAVFSTTLLNPTRLQSRAGNKRINVKIYLFPIIEKMMHWPMSLADGVFGTGLNGMVDVGFGLFKRCFDLMALGDKTGNCRR
uniref:Uncharacterized protein n=1 Tax=Candidatus Kentrum sp. TUN TaxID=2126343 RepID=A0A450ZU08_9GAMM|nr:MAG: hypothetical protein BECKTUN1418D_GA0071000_100811 [Candidatus Kentron sp. TUN]VFK57261.1 MAG: hypothetical protein BECKTUN1418F_GA0071002_111011 [Candidatus Kentron sp. TUN]VFK65385.1 MAG: hypothetical protein BECKTUN1418E_GA0071001_110611 [Candidatus Kentron sp. TUN]